MWDMVEFSAFPVLKLKYCAMFWYWWFVKTYWNSALPLSTCLIFSVPHLSPCLWALLCVWVLINICVYNCKCTDLALSVNLPVLRPFLPPFLPHTLCTKNLTSTTLNQMLQSSNFREKCQLQQSWNGFILQQWHQRAALWLPGSVRSFQWGYRSAIKSLHLSCGLCSLEWPCS